MWEKLFLSKLQREAPRWIEQGWITTEGQNAVFADMEARVGGTKHIPLAFGTLGAVLLGIGIISFFAANWPEIPKLARLAILLGAMWSSFFVASWLYSPRRADESSIAKALVLLGVILYGSSIFLIAQTFHIQAHFPNGILFWALGALISAYLIPIQMVAVLGLALAGLWASMDHFSAGLLNDFNATLPTPFPYAGIVYWPFILVLGAFAFVAEKQSWRFTAWVSTFGLLAWSVATLFGIAEATYAHFAAVLHVGLLLSFLVFLFLMTETAGRALDTFAAPLSRISLISGFICFYALTTRAGQGVDDWGVPDPIGLDWTVAIAILAAFAMAYLWLRSARQVRPSMQKQATVGKAIATATILISVANVLLWDVPDRAIPAYIAFNALLFFGLIWLIFSGYTNSDRFTVNVGFIFFALTVLTLYFDTFWLLLDRSFFFMAGGLLLLGGGYFLERQRRRVMQAMAGPTATNRDVI